MNTNPFVLPGFGQSGPTAQNPVLASMEMMRQAWEGLASSGGMDAAAMGKIMSIEEMDKRIADLRAVENWLRMNLSMLTSTIQGLEVQRATVATLKSFVDTGLSSVTQPSGAAPEGQSRTRPGSSLDEVLGLRPAASEAQSAGASEATAAATPSETQQAQSAASGADQGAASADQSDIMAAAATAAQGWWNLLQQQFETLAAATAATAEDTLADLAEAGKAAQAAAAGDSGTKPARKTPAKTAARSTSAKKAAVKKTAAKKAAKATKTVAKKSTTARKTAR